MADLIRTAFAGAWSRLWRALMTVPGSSGWGFSAGLGCLALATMAVVGLSGHLYHLGAPSLAGLPTRLVSVIFVPSLGEEVVFRGILVPDRSETSRPFAAIAVASIIFMGRHVAETLFLRHAAPIFLRADFLACAGIFGVGCAVVRWRTASL